MYCLNANTVICRRWNDPLANGTFSGVPFNVSNAKQTAFLGKAFRKHNRHKHKENESFQHDKNKMYLLHHIKWCQKYDEGYKTYLRVHLQRKKKGLPVLRHRTH